MVHRRWYRVVTWAVVILSEAKDRGIFSAQGVAARKGNAGILRFAQNDSEALRMTEGVAG